MAPGSARGRTGSSATPLRVCCAPSPSAALLFLVQWRVKRRSGGKRAQWARANRRASSPAVQKGGQRVLFAPRPALLPSRGGAMGPSHQKVPRTGRDRRGGAGGRAQGGAGGAPVAVQGGGVSESVAKAPRAGIGREKKRGIPTIPFARLGSIRAFATDSDNRCRRGSPGGAPRVGRRPRREPPAPRRALRTRECSSNRCSRRQNARLEGKMRISTRKGLAAVVADRGAGPVPEHLQ